MNSFFSCALFISWVADWCLFLFCRVNLLEIFFDNHQHSMILSVILGALAERTHDASVQELEDSTHVASVVTAFSSYFFWILFLIRGVLLCNCSLPFFWDFFCLLFVHHLRHLFLCCFSMCFDFLWVFSIFKFYFWIDSYFFVMPSCPRWLSLFFFATVWFITQWIFSWSRSMVIKSWLALILFFAVFFWRVQESISFVLPFFFPRWFRESRSSPQLRPVWHCSPQQAVPVYICFRPDTLSILLFI